MTPQRTTQNVTRIGVALTLTVYTATTNDEQLAVVCGNLPSAPQGAAVQTGLDDGINGSVRDTNGKLVSRNNTTFLGQPAEDAVVQAQAGVSHERIVFVGSKIYAFTGVTRTLEAPHPAYDQLLATFKTS